MRSLGTFGEIHILSRLKNHKTPRPVTITVSWVSLFLPLLAAAASDIVLSARSTRKVSSITLAINLFRPFQFRTRTCCASIIVSHTSTRVPHTHSPACERLFTVSVKAFVGMVFYSFATLTKERIFLNSIGWVFLNRPTITNRCISLQHRHTHTYTVAFADHEMIMLQNYRVPFVYRRA